MVITAIGKFNVLGPLGSGANSTILHIRRVEDGRDYALKVVTLDGEDDQKYLDQINHELHVGQMLNHPSLVKIHALELEKGFLGLGPVKKAKLLVEYVPGDTLDKAKLIKPAKLYRVLEKVASGLAHMHAKGVLHADLKPANIMMGRGTNAKVIDYGLAWIKGQPKDRVQGTPEYLAPETAAHKMVSERTDIYNFGATMYRLATFQLPPSHVSVDGMKLREKDFKAALKPVLELVPSTNPEFAKLIHDCLEFDAHKRPHEMAAVQARLEKLADAAEATAHPADLE
jgi:serine/threonine protein kinase